MNPEHLSDLVELKRDLIQDYVKRKHEEARIWNILMIIAFIGYQTVTSTNSKNSDELYVNYFYWVSSVVCIVMTAASFVHNSIVFGPFPVSVILLCRNMFRLLDFENTKFVPIEGDKNPFMASYSQWGNSVIQKMSIAAIFAFI